MHLCGALEGEDRTGKKYLHNAPTNACKCILPNIGSVRQGFRMNLTKSVKNMSCLFSSQVRFHPKIKRHKYEIVDYREN